MFRKGKNKTLQQFPCAFVCLFYCISDAAECCFITLSCCHMLLSSPNPIVIPASRTASKSVDMEHTVISYQAPHFRAVNIVSSVPWQAVTRLVNDAVCSGTLTDRVYSEIHTSLNTSLILQLTQNTQKSLKELPGEF